MRALKYRLHLIVLITMLFLGCRQDYTKQDVPEIAELEKAYSVDPSDDNFASIIKRLSDLLQDAEEKEGKRRFINKGLELTKLNGKDDYYYIFVKEFLKFYPEDSKHADKLWEFSEYLSKNNVVESTSIIRAGFRNMYPNDTRSAEIKIEIINQPEDIESYVKQKAEAIFKYPDETGLNKNAVKDYIDACEAIVIAFPRDSMSGEYLFRAAEMARSVRAFPKSLSIYDWLLTSYPQYDKTSLVFFLRGFIYENEMKQKDKASKIYNRFLEKFPNDPMVGDVRFLLENIDKTEDEMIKLIEERQKSLSNPQNK